MGDGGPFLPLWACGCRGAALDHVADVDVLLLVKAHAGQDLIQQLTRPTKGRPLSSSWWPGPSPMSMSRAKGLPRRMTTWVRVAARPQRWQPIHSLAKASGLSPMLQCRGGYPGRGCILPREKIKLAALGAHGSSLSWAARGACGGLPQQHTVVLRIQQPLLPTEGLLTDGLQHPAPQGHGPLACVLQIGAT